MSVRSIRARVVAAACATLFFMLPVAAHANGVDAASISARLKAMNLPAEIVTDGDVHGIDSSFGPDQAFSIYLNGCDAQRANCRTVQFHADYTDSKAGPAEMNAFNAGHRFGRGYIDVTGEPSLSMDVFAASLGEDHFAETADLWKRLMEGFAETIFPS